MSMPRTQLQAELEAILGSRNVYFQRPGTTQMTYPSIVYKLDNKKDNRANNKRYLTYNRYSVEVISPKSTNTIADEILEHFAHSSFDRRFVSDNLYHDAVTLYF